ncbi:hypothetical protein DTW90_36980 [Neorhizobium sp. P12A]|nr:hypothetical protein DTW90_36980 [Neorhizobium sp. P12A]
MKIGLHGSMALSLLLFGGAFITDASARENLDMTRSSQSSIQRTLTSQATDTWGILLPSNAKAVFTFSESTAWSCTIAILQMPIGFQVYSFDSKKLTETYSLQDPGDYNLVVYQTMGAARGMIPCVYSFKYEVGATGK